MDVKTFAPSARLAPFVRCYQVVETSEEAVRTLLPEAGLIVGFRYRGQALQLEDGEARHVPDAVITGLRRSARHMHTSAGGGIVVVKFREVGASAFFAAPLHALFGTSEPLESLVPKADVERAAACIAGASSHGERVAALEDFLLARLTPRPQDAQVQAAAQVLRARRGQVRIDALARSLLLSQDALEKRFRRVVGTSPKQFASLLRLQAAVSAYRPGLGLTELALQAGYYDQAHFTREFRAAMGAPPGRFFGDASYC